MAIGQAGAILRLSSKPRGNVLRLVELPWLFALALIAITPLAAETLPPGPSRLVEFRQMPSSGGIGIERLELFDLRAQPTPRSAGMLALPDAYRALDPSEISVEIHKSVGLRFALAAPERLDNGRLGLPHPRVEAGDRLAVRARIAPTRVAAAATTSMRLPSDHLRTEARLRLTPEGAMIGEARTSASGPSEERLNRFLAGMEKAGADGFTATLMRRQALEGKLAILPQEGGVSTRFTLAPLMGRDGRHTVSMMPGPRLVRGAYVELVSHIRERRSGDVACPFQIQEQAIEMTLDAPERIGALPPDVAIRIGATAYDATYRREGNTIHVERRLVLDIGGETCSPAKLREIAPVIHAAAHDMSRRLSLTN